MGEVVRGNQWLDGACGLEDEACLVLHGQAKLCARCFRTILIRYLVGGECPDCRSKDEPVAVRPHPVEQPHYFGASKFDDCDY